MAVASSSTMILLAGSSLRLPFSSSSRVTVSPPSTSGRVVALGVRADSGPLKQAEKAVENTKVNITRESVLQHQEDESEKRSVVGTIPRPGATIPRPEVERRPETGDTSFLSQMSFDGAGPETINGRLAMVGFWWAIATEYFTKQSVIEQLTSASNRGLIYFLVVAQVIAYGSLVPILRGESPDSRQVGPFNAKAERWNGRLAMLGFAGLVIFEAASGSALLH
eukprot:TRINITY_DN13311_c0_g1_i1.p1 TRINITY_DN13311_c0_g1~~TRINITY_DN13311_c0_g1_i1.p1  ORF type:complete len:260 (+),score=26.58 TRINITY_DN13311_c0_g1_i1:112-780(+)